MTCEVLVNTGESTKGWGYYHGMEGAGRHTHAAVVATLHVQVGRFVGVEMDDGPHFADARRRAAPASAAEAIVDV